MKKDLKRRDFITRCFGAGIACCALSHGGLLSAQDQDTKPDPKKLEYCGYKCPDDCPLKKATLENNPELKKKAYDYFQFKEKYNVEFDEKQVFCYGCKTEGKPESLVVKACTFRACAIEKKYDCCIKCDNLAKCDKELWTRFPKFKETVIDMQKKYKSA
jgi:hypothetical protein